MDGVTNRNVLLGSFGGSGLPGLLRRSGQRHIARHAGLDPRAAQQRGGIVKVRGLLAGRGRHRAQRLYP